MSLFPVKHSAGRWHNCATPPNGGKVKDDAISKPLMVLALFLLVPLLVCKRVRISDIHISICLQVGNKTCLVNDPTVAPLADSCYETVRPENAIMFIVRVGCW